MAKGEKTADLFDHLSELRSRLIRILIYVVIGTAVAWVLYKELFTLLTGPMTPAMNKIGSKFLLTSFPEAFIVQFQVCAIAGLILVFPLVTLEVWGFVSPALTRSEKRPLIWCVPLTIFLFVSGVILCYFILPTAFKWFASYIPETAEVRPTLQHSIRFTVFMLLSFGVIFELPVFLMLLAKFGIVDSRMLKDNWRYAIVIVSIVAAVATPSNDAFTMLTLAIPVALLYFGSILLVRVIEKKHGKL